MVTLLWLHSVGLVLFALARGNGIIHSLAEGATVATAAAVASSTGGRRVRSGVAAFGLIAASAIALPTSPPGGSTRNAASKPRAPAASAATVAFRTAVDAGVTLSSAVVEAAGCFKKADLMGLAHQPAALMGTGGQKAQLSSIAPLSSILPPSSS
ncbi:MAG TPA: hypothetical protein VHM89_12940 [Acidimicrobiales bacterium]|nr:hypothetical protein [Acidimicrobiales bacterium]